MPSKHVGQLCRRCNALEAALTVRSEPLCRDCFVKYVHTKVIKRMEGFRTRHVEPGQQRKLLLPISFGASSVTLLYILDKQLQTQTNRTGRTGFNLHVVHFINPLDADNDSAKRLDLVKERFPSHEFSIIPFEGLFSKTSPTPSQDAETNNISMDELSMPSLEALLNALPSATSRSDVLTILRTRLAINCAREHQCEGILWGDSTTKLAEKILAETAKGRGFSLPWQVADGESPYGLSFYYPMKDLLKKELLSHADIAEPSLKPLISPDAFERTQAPPSAKNTTIDVSMQQYFESVEENYPGIVSNVVRTVGKLQARVPGNIQRCRLCKLPVTHDLLGLNGWGGDQAVAPPNENSECELCYGCARSIPPEAVALLPA